MRIPFDAAWRHHDRYARALKLLGRYGAGDWLDYGCGSGYGTQYLAGFTTGIIGFDPDAEAIEKSVGSQKIAYSSDQKWVTRCAPYDAIFMIEVLEHLDEHDLPPLLCTFLDIVGRPAGRLVVSTPFCTETNRDPVNPHHKIEYGWEHLRKLLKDCGWTTCTADFFPVKWTDGTTGQQAIVLCQPSKNT